LWNGQKHGGEINGSERAEEVRVQEACTGRISHISIRRIPEEKVIWYKDHSLVCVHGRETSCPFLIMARPQISFLNIHYFLNRYNILKNASWRKV